MNVLASPYDLPPPPPDASAVTLPKRSKKKLYAAVIIAVVVISIFVPVLFLLLGNSKGNAAANASTLKYSQLLKYDDGSGGVAQSIATVYVKNFGTPNTLSRTEEIYQGEQIIGITDDGKGESWAYYQGKWNNQDWIYNQTLSRQTWDFLKTELRSWDGAGALEFTFMESNVTIYNIEVNPNLPDSLFQR
jgi:hypothetical protein